MVESYDVLVAGARIAGSTLAACLGDAGHRVLLIDRATFPSSTLSTHFFRGVDAVSVLSELGVLDETLALGCPPLVRQYCYYGGVGPAVEPPQSPGDIGYCLSVRREPLDALLVRRAGMSESVDVLERTRLVELIRDRDRVTGARLSTPDGDREVHARIVVAADGRHSAVAKHLDLVVEESAEPIRGV